MCFPTLFILKKILFITSLIYNISVGFETKPQKSLSTFEVTIRSSYIVSGKQDEYRSRLQNYVSLTLHALAVVPPANED